MRYLLLISLFTFSLPLNTAAEENNVPSPQHLSTYNKDVTDDSTEETIKMKGKFLAPDSDYYAELWASVSNHEEKKWKIPYEGGYDPKMQFFDLNHDGVNDLFFQSAAGGSGNSHHYHLHTLKNNQLEEIPLPKQEFIKTDFKNDFKVAIQIDHEQEPTIVDVKDRSSEYVQLGIYDENGQLLDNTSPMIAPIAFFQPVEISEGKGYGLKSHQQISGAYQADKLGTVETLWYYEKGQWIILKTEWVPS
ncbi:hypothetical protein [Lentibacillus salicampi]|uniref:VCBS repeat-containing protein n=1 Tax=Lentibacillus salicampi TaxID=175306 RepID=A0A4Y9AEL4_9BACI|nr:hypothetical protein [Lentibacillus salicampi]TFJ92821.1 hypothetical protein E4U82_10495 [Lentibacillus salicampi]